MPYIPKLLHLAKMLLRIRDERAAEGLWFEGLWLSERGDDQSARQAFLHSCLLDRRFGGAYYNYAALTEKLLGRGAPETRTAWENYIRVAEKDPRQPRATIEKVRGHLAELGRG
jgi:hypothetical protein